jgi:glycosyltransferase involved in cell wall biosynthesis
MLDSNNKVSVVIPVYNSERFLQESIESVIDQTYPHLEIICVNDGSTDNSLEILNSFSDKIKIIDKKNGGLASALNSGIEEMSGVWFKWFSPDDVMYPEAIETLVAVAKILDENTIIYSNWDIIDENGKKLRSFNESNYNDLGMIDFNTRLLDGQQINVNTTLIPTSLFSKGCNFQELEDPVAIDYDFFLRAGIIYQTKFHLIPKNLIKYRIHSNQTSHQKISQTLSYLTKIRSDILSKLDSSTREKYLNNLNKFKKQKPLVKKTLELGFKIAQSTLPEEVTDKLVVFYLNKIRRTRT